MQRRKLLVGGNRRGALAALLLLALTCFAADTQPLKAREAVYHVGSLLVAAPAMADPRFRESVIYLVRHGDDGAFGLMVNRPLTDVPLADLLSGMGIDAGDAEGTVTLHYGGPVEPAAGFVLHSPDYADKDTVVVDGRFAMTTNPEILRAIGEGRGPSSRIIAFGYAGWAPGQLQGELDDGSWFVVPADEALVFGDDHAGKWRRALDRRSIDL